MSLSKYALQVNSGSLSSLASSSSYVTRSEADDLRQKMDFLMTKLTHTENKLTHTENRMGQLCDRIVVMEEQSQQQMVRSTQLQLQLSTGVVFSPEAFAQYLSSKEFKSMVFGAIYTEAPFLCQMR